MRYLVSILCVWLATFAAPASALPTMIRLGYNDCASCHLAPQGGGLLTDYGKGVDVAQSLRTGEYEPPPDANGKLRYDFRFLAMASHVVEPDDSSATTTGLWLMFRNAMRLSARHRFAHTVALANTSVLGSTGGQPTVVVSKAAWEYRAADGLELAVGRDELPSGLGLPEPQEFIRNAVDAGSAAYPAQAKLFWWTPHLQVSPYVFASIGEQAHESHRDGAGLLAAVDVWKRRAMVGVSGRVSRGDMYDGRNVGAFARLGFGRWGILAEHDLARRASHQSGLTMHYYTGHTQVFIAPYEWFVTSLALEHLASDGAEGKRRYRLAPGAQIRVSDTLTLRFSTREVFSEITGARTRTYTVNLFVKTVN